MLGSSAIFGTCTFLRGAADTADKALIPLTSECERITRYTEPVSAFSAVPVVSATTPTESRCRNSRKIPMLALIQRFDDRALQVRRFRDGENFRMIGRLTT